MNTSCFLMRRHAEYLKAVETTNSAAASEATMLAQNELYGDSSDEIASTNPDENPE